MKTTDFASVIGAILIIIIVTFIPVLLGSLGWHLLSLGGWFKLLGIFLLLISALKVLILGIIIKETIQQ